MATWPPRARRRRSGGARTRSCNASSPPGSRSSEQTRDSRGPSPVKPAWNRALAVGVLAAATGVAFLLALTFFRKGGYSEKESYLVHAFFGDATGISWKTRAQIAGIQIGEVANIQLVGSRARLDIRVKNGVELHTDACLTKTFPSALLPDALLEVQPGSPDKPLLTSLPESERRITF